MSTPPASERAKESAPAVNLGLRLRLARQESGSSLRQLAGRLGVSPSFLSQIENGKAQPSVATLYALAQMLSVSIDHLFDEVALEEPAPAPAPETGQEVEEPAPDISTVLTRAAARKNTGAAQGGGDVVNRTDLGSLDDVWTTGANVSRLSVTSPGRRTKLVMDSGVIWEQLATNTAHQLDFIEITYPPGASSTSDERMLRHDGFEYGYLLEGELEVTLGFDVFVLRAGEALGLNSSVPHLFRNKGTVPAKGIWFVHHRHD